MIYSLTGVKSFDLGEFESFKKICCPLTHPSEVQRVFSCDVFIQKDFWDSS